jgi:arylsulfatase A-like enzyme
MSPRVLLLAGLLLHGCLFARALQHDPKQRQQRDATNLLLVMFDDLRPELSIYGREHMITPNFERLAKRSVVFDYAYCQVAVCNPSRDSMLTGLRPDTISVYGFQNSYGYHMIWPKQLARSGYNTAGIGKIRHWDDKDTETWTHVWNDTMVIPVLCTILVSALTFTTYAKILNQSGGVV